MKSQVQNDQTVSGRLESGFQLNIDPNPKCHLVFENVTKYFFPWNITTNKEKFKNFLKKIKDKDSFKETSHQGSYK